MIKNDAKDKEGIFEGQTQFLEVLSNLVFNWVHRFVFQRQRQMRGDKMTNPGLSCDKSTGLSRAWILHGGTVRPVAG